MMTLQRAYHLSHTAFKGNLLQYDGIALDDSKFRAPATTIQLLEIR
jgi:hypothetical protein